MDMQLFDFSFPSYSFRIREDKVREIWDMARKQWVKFTPEEYVRQHAIHFLHADLKFPLSLMAVEKSVVFNTMSRRPDLILFDKQARPFLIAEFKSPEVKLSRETLEQALRYHSVLGASYLFLSNGHEHALCQVLSDNQGKWIFHSNGWDDVLASWASIS